MTPEQEFLESSDGKDLAADLKERLDINFIETHYGRPHAVSEYGVAYTTYGMIVQPSPPDGLQSAITLPALLKGAFIGYIDLAVEELKKQGDVLVWRIVPTLEAPQEFDVGPMARIKLRFRAHATSYEKYLATLSPVNGVHPTAGRAPHDIGWAVERLKLGEGVCRRGGSPLLWYINGLSTLSPPDLLATDWELAD